jgi:uncharacterized protein YodC (DUF2158 family)
MQYEDLKKGDTVKLQTGSPNMNIVGFSCGGVLCKWVADNGTPCQDIFPVECLVEGGKETKYLNENN